MSDQKSIDMDIDLQEINISQQRQKGMTPAQQEEPTSAALTQTN